MLRTTVEHGSTPRVVSFLKGATRLNRSGKRAGPPAETGVMSGPRTVCCGRCCETPQHFPVLLGVCVLGAPTEVDERCKIPRHHFGYFGETPPTCEVGCWRRVLRMRRFHEWEQVRAELLGTPDATHHDAHVDHMGVEIGTRVELGMKSNLKRPNHPT